MYMSVYTGTVGSFSGSRFFFLGCAGKDCRCLCALCLCGVCWLCSVSIVEWNSHLGFVFLGGRRTFAAQAAWPPFPFNFTADYLEEEAPRAKALELMHGSPMPAFRDIKRTYLVTMHPHQKKNCARRVTLNPEP